MAKAKKPNPYASNNKRPHWKIGQMVEFMVFKAMEGTDGDGNKVIAYCPYRRDMGAHGPRIRRTGIIKRHHDYKSPDIYEEMWHVETKDGCHYLLYESEMTLYNPNTI